MSGAIRTVDPHQVEHGDTLAGRPHCRHCGIPVVDSILFNASGQGTWMYYDAAGHLLAEVGRLDRIQVLADIRRPIGSSSDTAGTASSPVPADLDPCPPHGIVRNRGLWLVAP